MIAKGRLARNNEWPSRRGKNENVKKDEKTKGRKGKTEQSCYSELIRVAGAWVGAAHPALYTSMHLAKT
jgi:hypothetical protein